MFSSLLSRELETSYDMTQGDPAHPEQAVNADCRDHSFHKALDRALAENNPFELARELLLSCGSLQRFQFDLKRGNVALVRQRLTRACHSLKDPALFIVQVLVSIGAVAKIRNVERDLELAISHMLVESLEFYLRALQETKTISSDAERISSAESVCYTSQKEQLLGGATSREDFKIDEYLITFGECCIDDSGNSPKVEKGVCSRSMATSTETADGTPSSTENVSPQLGRNAIDHRSLLDSNEGSVDKIPMLPQPSQTPDMAEMSLKRIADHSPATCSYLGPCLQTQNGAAANEKDVDDYDWLREDAPSRESSSPPLKSASQVDVYSAGSPDQEQYAALLSDTKVPCSISSASVPKLSLNIKGNAYPIQQRHREMLLKEIAARKNALQVFVALDVFEMRPCLMRPLGGEQENSDTYGSTLAHQLMAIGRLYEAAVVVSRFFCVRNAMLDLELLSRLLEIPDERKDRAVLVLEFVGNHQDTCRVVLQEIDLRLSMRHAQWSKEDIEGDHGSMLGFSEMFTSSTSGAGSSDELMQTLSTPRSCVRLMEIAMSLVMRFQLEDSQHHYSGIVFFSRFCTVTTLLEYQSSCAEYQLFPPTNSSCTEPTKRPVDNGLPRPWVLLPVVLSTIKGNRMLQMLTIQYCVVERKDSATANIIATKLGLGDYYQYCVTKKQNSKPQAPADAIQYGQASLEKTKFSTVASSSKTSPSSQWLEPTSDLWRSPCTWPRSAAKSALPAIHHGESPYNLALHQHRQQKPQLQVQKLRRTNSVLPFYRLPANTSVILVYEAAQLPQLWKSLWHSAAVGIDSEWRPTMSTFDLNRSNVRRSVPVSFTTLIQLACDIDNRVYLLDVVALKPDCSERLVKILGNFFSNPSVRKIAYDWQGDKARLEMTFPALQQRCYQMENFVDLRYVWFHYRYCGLVMPDANKGPTSFDSCNNTLNDFRSVDSRHVPAQRPTQMPRRVEVIAWSTLTKTPGLMSRCCTGGLSGMLSKLCGPRLDKTQQCSDWEHRPLSEQQMTYAAIDARCLLDINQVLTKAQRIE